MKYDELPPEIPVGRSKDLRGQKFEMLTPIYRCRSLTASNKDKSYWVCLCDCGEYCIKRTDHLTTNRAKSCGCIDSFDLTGQRFGKLVALEPVSVSLKGKVKTMRKWKCICDCGRECFVPTTHLIGEKKVSSCPTCSRMHDLTGQKFGKLTALKPTERDKWGSWKWLCQCECGKQVEIIGDSLTTGSTKSCGCLNSKNEYLIESILRDNSINYIQQATFPTCINPLSNFRLKFDFYLPDYNCCIEYDGEQHFHEIKSWSSLKDIQYRDSIKNKWCKENNVILKRIPYWKKSEISFETLMDDTFTYKE